MVRRVLPEEVELCPHTAAVAGHLEVATHPGLSGDWPMAPENPPVMGTIASGYDIRSLPCKDPPCY